MSSFILKIIAIITMLCDHFSSIYFKGFSFLNVIGRIAFPIFAFQIVQGYIHTHNLKNYCFKLLGFGLVSQVAYSLFRSACGYTTFSINVLATLLLGLIAIFAYDKISNSNINFLSSNKSKKIETKALKRTNTILALIICFGIACFADVIKADYGMFGVFLILSFYIFKDNKLGMFLSTLIITCLLYLSQMLLANSLSVRFFYCVIGTLLALIPIFLYNKKEGPKCKYLFYIFYPLHLLILSLIF